MAYTEKQWNNFQASLPVEERMSYLDYLQEAEPDVYKKYLTSIIENLKAAEVSSNATLTEIVDERTKFAGAKIDTAAQKAAQKAATKVVSNFRAAETASAKIDTPAPVPVSAVESAAQERAVKAEEAKAAADFKLEQQAAAAELSNKVAQAIEAAKVAATAAVNKDPDAEALKEAADAAAADADATAILASATPTDSKPLDAETIAATETVSEKIATAIATAAAAATATASGDPNAAAAVEAADAAAADADATATVSSVANAEVAAAQAAADTVTTLAAGDTLNEPPGRPGKAWIVAADGKTWVKPGRPTDGKDYSWSDDSGWIFATEEPQEYTTVNGVLTFKNAPFTGTYNGKNYKDGKIVEEPATEEYTTVGGVLMFKGAAFTGAYNGKNYKDGKIVENTGDAYTTVGGLLNFNGKPFTGAYQGKNYKDGVVVAAEADADNVKTYTATDGTVFTDQVAFAAYQKILSDKTLADEALNASNVAKRQSAYDLLYAEFANYGLGSLVEPLRGLIQSGASPAEFSIKLRESEPYKKRFSANAQRISKGLKAIGEAEYLGLEDQYQSILRNAGLPESYWKRGDLGVQEGFTNFIANDVSAVELEDRVSTAQQRLIYANPEVSIALKTFYPDISNGDLLAYALDPTKGLDQIKRRITAAEIGSSAVQLGLTSNVTDAEYLARYGVNKAQAQQGYRTAAEILPTASKLGDIYSKQGLGAYTQQTAEQEIFNVPGAAEAAAKRRKLSELEQASFSGRAGMGALARERAGAF